MRLIDADATVKYLRECRCNDCDRRKGMKNGKIVFCYEIGEAPCRACDIEDTIDYFLDEDISPTVDAVPVIRCRECIKRKSDKCLLYWNEIKDDETWDDDWYCADGEART